MCDQHGRVSTASADLNSSKPESPSTAKEDDSSFTEEFITLPPQKPFTRAVAGSVEYRPAAVIIICQFLNKLTAKCKEDLHKLGCVRKVTEAPSHTSKRRYHHHHHETWEKRFLRLKVYQRAFSSIVMYFKAYCPVLFYIKKSYEDMLSYRINQIKQAHFEKKRLHIQKHHMKHQMKEYVFPEYGQLLRNEKYLVILRQQISLQDEAIKVITDILKKMEEALSDHFERHRDLEEQIIMVDTEIANRRQKAFSQREKEEKDVAEKPSTADTESNQVSTIDSDEEDKEDPFYNMDVDEIDEERRMVWIMAFAICHQDIEECEKKISMYQTKYQYVVPRHEHEEMKRSIIDEKMVSKELAGEKGALENELENLKDTEEKLNLELSEVKTQLIELRTTVTPRPSWEQLGEFVQGGVPKWIKMIHGKSTKDTAEKLVSELRGRRGGEKVLPPLGMESNVLRCLRHAQKVADRNLHSRDAALLIHDIWLTREKVLLENMNAQPTDEYDYGATKENPATKSFADFVAIYFEDNYEDVDYRMEWTYNLVESCKRFSLDYRLTMFLNVLQGQCDENLYFSTRNELFRVRNSFLERSLYEDMPEGILSSNQYVEALEVVFPKKDEPDIQALVRVTNKMNQELNSGEDADLSIYHVTQLIDVRDDGFRGPLVSELVKQFEVDRQRFINQIIEKLAGLMGISVQSAQSETDPASNKDVTVIQAFSAIKRVDPDIDDEKVGAALAWIFTGTGVRPGSGISTARLVNYCKFHAGDEQSTAEPSVVSMVPSFPAADMGDMDEEKFERAIKDIVRDEDDDKDDDERDKPQVSEAQKKAYYRALKLAKLRTVVKKLKSSGLEASWQAYEPKESLLPEGAVNLKTDLEELKKTVQEAKKRENKVRTRTEGHHEELIDSDEDSEESHHHIEEEASSAPDANSAPASATEPPSTSGET